MKFLAVQIDYLFAAFVKSVKSDVKIFIVEYCWTIQYFGLRKWNADN